MKSSKLCVEQIALIEMHDAVIDRVVLPANGLVTLDFSKLYVYKTVAIERFEIWLYAAVLDLRGVSHLTLDGELTELDRVDDAEFTSDTGSPVEWKCLLDGSPVSGVLVRYGSGTQLVVRCDRAQLTLLEPQRHLEDWTGPL